MAQNPQDFTYPNPPNDMPSPLMKLMKGPSGLPWTSKPLPKAKGQSKGQPKMRPGPKTSRSGVHKLGKMKKSGGWY